MKQFILYLLLLPVLFITGCLDINQEDPYNNQLNTLLVHAIYPEGYTEFLREGVTVKIENVDLGYSYQTETNASGIAEFTITNGVYRISVSDRTEESIFNGTADRVIVANQDVTISLSLIRSRPGTIIIKEIYCGGCTKDPEEGNYQYDKYIILHNNGSETEYLDGLCFGALDPYNSNATNVWVIQDATTGETIYPDFVPIIQCIWQFGGDGSSFPLLPGEDAVLAITGAIDHTAQYPLSVNLNKSGYFVCYNPVYFTNITYHPAPGDQITPDHYLDVVIKTGQANAYTYSTTSPATVLFKAKNTTIQDFILEEGNVIQKPGSAVDRVVKIPLDWIMDGVEVFNGSSSSNIKRLPPDIDAGYVNLSEPYKGRTLHRLVDEEATLEVGYEILVDTNNSSNDFYEREQQSLHE